MPNDFLEKTFEDIIFENKHRIHERGFDTFYKNTERQYILESGNRIDLFTWEVDSENVLFFKVIELKKEKCLIPSFWQALDYYSEIVLEVAGHFSSIKGEIILCGTDIDENLYNLPVLPNNNIVFYVYKYEYDGIKFYGGSRTTIEDFTTNRKQKQPDHVSRVADYFKRNSNEK